MGIIDRTRYPTPRGPVTEVREPIPVTITLMARLAPIDVQGLVEAWSADRHFGQEVRVVRCRFEVGGVTYVQWKWIDDVTPNGPPPRV